MMKYLLSLTIIVAVSSCAKLNSDPACHMTPEPDVCEAIGPEGYYFDRKKRKCVKYRTGGCTDLIFTSLEDCQECHLPNKPECGFGEE